MMKNHVIGVKKGDDPITSAAVFDSGAAETDEGYVEAKGSIFMCLNKDAVRKVDSRALCQAAQHVRDIMAHYELGTPDDELLLEIESFIENSGYILFLTPSLIWPDVKLKSLLKCFVLLSYFDLYLRNKKIGAELEKEFGANYHNKILEIVSDTFSGKYYAKEDSATKKLAHFDKACAILYAVYEELFRSCYGYKQRSKVFRNALINWIVQHRTLIAQKVKPMESQYSYLTVKQHSGFIIGLELIGLVCGIELTDGARDNFMLEAVVHSATTVVNWVRDLVHFKRDVELKKCPCENYVLWKASTDDEYENKVQILYEEVATKQQEHMVDYLEFRQVLKSWYPEDLQLHKFLMLLDEYVDGVINLILNWKNEGKQNVAAFVFTDVYSVFHRGMEL